MRIQVHWARLRFQRSGRSWACPSSISGILPTGMCGASLCVSSIKATCTAHRSDPRDQVIGICAQGLYFNPVERTHITSKEVCNHF